MAIFTELNSERCLEDEVTFNLAYRWFYDLDLMQKVPEHSIFSQNRKPRFKENNLFRDIFNEIVLQCIKMELDCGETGVADGSFLSANVSWDKRNETVEIVERSTIKYMEELDEELASMPGYPEPEVKNQRKQV